MEVKQELEVGTIKKEDDDMEDSFSPQNGSSFLDESIESGGGYMEELLLFNDTIEVPADLFSDPIVFGSIFSLDNLSPHLKQTLMSLLPNFPSDDAEEKMKSLKMLFGGENIAFGNPLHNFRREVLKGNYSPDRRRLKEYVRSAKLRDDKIERHEYNFRLMSDVLKSRKTIMEETSGSTVSVPIAVQKLEKQTLRLGAGMKHRTKRRYLEEIKRIKAALGEDGLSSDDEDILKECQEHDVEVSLIPDAKSSIKSAVGVKEEKPASNIDEDKMRMSLTQECQQSYFHLISDLFMLGNLKSANHGLRTISELDSAMSVWQESPIAALNSWYPLATESRGWRSFVPSAVAFLSGSFPDQVPPDFAPYISMEKTMGCYQWVGDGREGGLSSLFDWWWERRDACKAGILNPQEAGGEGPTPAVEGEGAQRDESAWRSNPTTSLDRQERLKPSTPLERQEYQRQESKRYANPSQPFRWVLKDYSVCVGRVKGSLTVKGKNHAMLKTNRPPYVTVLTLVRDAVSRLPNGEGSRIDIMELLKDSQYLNPNLDMDSLTVTISGALDRLQNETDSCVKYDPNSKIWVYLHRDKTLEELENMMVNSKPKPRTKKKIKLEDLREKPTAAIRQSADFGAEHQGLEEQRPTSILGLALGGEQHASYSSSLLIKKQGSPGRSVLSYTPSTPKRLYSGMDCSTSSSPLQHPALPPAQGGDPGVARMIVQGADGQILPLSPAALQKLIMSGAVEEDSSRLLSKSSPH